MNTQFRTLQIPPTPPLTWTSLYYMLHAMPRRQALLVATAWKAAADSRNAGLLSNLLCNTLHPTGVLQVLDYSGIELPKPFYSQYNLEQPIPPEAGEVQS
jgi:hypothetical protein